VGIGVAMNGEHLGTLYRAQEGGEAVGEVMAGGVGGAP
jgi:hypothetical protein